MKKEDREHLREEWARRLKEWEASGLRPTEYCRANNVNEGRFHYWNRKLFGNKLDVPSFVKVPISPMSRPCPIRIEIGKRFCVEVDNGCDFAALEHVIGILIRA
jgi:hypothetical protein